ncbi:MAG: hypothetical protein RLZZ584_4334 [Pseudomonadota bacterium]
MSITLLCSLAGCAWLPWREAPEEPAALPAQVQPDPGAATFAIPPVTPAAPAAEPAPVAAAAPPATGPANAEAAASAPVDATAGERRPARKWAINDAALDIIKTAESPGGPRLQAYLEGKRWFIGYGHPAVRGQVITEKRALALLRQDVHKCERQVAASVKVPVTRNEFSAMVSLCHNIGTTRYAKSEVVAYLNQGGRVEAAEAFNEWIYPAGLAPRRRKEMALFMQQQ